MTTITLNVEVNDQYLGTRTDIYDEVEDFTIHPDGGVHLRWSGGGTYLPSGSFERIDYEEFDEDEE